LGNGGTTPTSSKKKKGQKRLTYAEGPKPNKPAGLEGGKKAGGKGIACFHRGKGGNQLPLIPLGGEGKGGKLCVIRSMTEQAWVREEKKPVSNVLGKLWHGQVMEEKKRSRGSGF